MSFLKRLFGLGAADKGAPAASEPEPAGDPVEHKGFTIQATPFQEGGQFQTCGLITKQVDGEVKTHRFIRADRFPSRDDAAETSLRKGRQIVDEQGERLFAER